MPYFSMLRCAYAGDVTTTISYQNRQGTKFIGEGGWLHVCRDGLDASGERWTKSDFETGPVKVYKSPGHIRNFLDCCKSRRACATFAETAHRSITPGHLAYVSQALRCSLRRDPKREVFIDNEKANTLLQTAEYRDPWELS